MHIQMVSFFLLELISSLFFMTKTTGTSKPNGAEVAKLEVPRETPKSLTPGSAPRPPSTEQVPRPSTETPNDLSAAPANHLSTETSKPVNLADPKAVSPEAEKATPLTLKQRFVKLRKLHTPPDLINCVLKLDRLNR
jgi:hypothetical protein